MATPFDVPHIGQADQEILVALTLATGANLDPDVETWPVGLALAWNDAAAAGAFTDAATIGAMARAFLENRLARLAPKS